MKGNAPTLAVLEAKTNHLLAIAELEAETLPGPWGVETLTSLMANAHGLVLVATRASREGTERLIGYAAVSWVLDEAELLRLTVSQKQRRRGVGRRLVAAVLSRLRQLGVERLRLEVRANNEAARAFYGVLQFSNVGHRGAYYQDGEDAVILERSVS